jgi:hypothetical protein
MGWGVAGLISEEVAIELVDGHKNKMHVQVVGFLRDIFHGVIKVVWYSYWLLGFIAKLQL